jgi:septal ring factor EnvC (AmiA/AmiB activator)
MQDKKNFLIGALAVLLLLSSIWGQLENGKKKQLEQENQTLQEQVEQKLDDREGKKKSLAENLAKAEKELATLRQEKGNLQTQLAKQTEQLNALEGATKGKLADCKAEQEQAVTEALAAQEVQYAETTEQLRLKQEATQAQVKESEELLLQRQQQFVQELKVLEGELTKQEQQAQKQMKALQDKLAQQEQQAQKQAQAIKEQKGKQEQLLTQQMQALQAQLNQQQELLTQQEKQLESAAKVIERDHQRIQACEQSEAELTATLKSLEETRAELAQVQKQAAALGQENEGLRAQIIGLERIVEQRTAALDSSSKELTSCKINTNVLISRISELESGQTPHKGKP